MPRKTKAEVGHPDAAPCIDTMIADGLKLVWQKPAESLEIFRRALLLLKRDDNQRRSRLMAFIGVCQENLANFAGALESNDAALRAARAGGHREEEGMILFNVGILYHRMGRFVDALPIFTQTLEIHRELGNRKKMANTLGSIGRCYSELGRFGEGVEAVAEALRCAIETGDEVLVARLRSLAATVYSELHEVLGDVRFRSDDLEHFKGAGNIAEAQVLTAEGERQGEQGHYDEALVSLHESLSLNRAIGSRYGEAVALALIGEIHWKLGELDTAMEYCEAAMAITAEIGHIDHSPMILNTIASIHSARGDRERAIEILQQSLAFAEQTGNRRLQPGIHRQLSEIHEEMGDIPQAFHHYKCFMTARNDMLNYESKRAIEHVQSQLQVERAEKERQIALMESERFEQEVAHKIRELSAMALSLRERNEVLERLKGRIITEMRTGKAESMHMLQDLLMEITMQESNPPSYREQTARIEESQARFNRTLIHRFPKLTPAELRICSLMRGNMSTKEIADLLSVTTRNVETHRYHIRKKLNLPKDASLITFLASL